MVIYKCPECETIFYKKYDFDNHLNRKTSCVRTDGGKSNKKKIDLTCKTCGKTYSRKDVLTRHTKICNISINGNNNNNTNTIITGNNNNNCNNNNNNIYNYNFNLISFGKDNIKCLDSEELINIINSNRNLYEELITRINFNPDKPEHHNVYYPDMKTSYGKVFENNKWVDKKIFEIIDVLLNANTERLNYILDNFDDALSKKTRNKIINTIKDVDFSNTQNRKKLISYIKPILYNNKDMVIKTIKILEELSNNRI